MSRQGSFSQLFRVSLVVTFLLGSSAVLLQGANDKNYTYLALGDSIAFGLDVRLLPPGHPVPSPGDFTGYPEKVAGLNHLLKAKKEVNASCPGESSASFMTAGAPDYGCHDLGPQGQPPFKSAIGLKANYAGTQLQFAVDELSSNKHINLVTLGIGSNDVLILLRECAAGGSPSCVNDRLPGVLQQYAQNLVRILTAIRVDAGYKGRLVLVKYYSPAAELDGIAMALNSTMEAAGTGFGAEFADGFKAFQIASALFGGDPCRAGLLVTLGPGVCDIHPSALGQDVLAGAVQFTLLTIGKK
jgi:lysophospholipase L1-like esterase